MKLGTVIVLAAGLVTCSETVRLKDQARGIEFLDHEYIGKHGYNCEELGVIKVASIPAEDSAERGLTVLDVKLMNEARKLGATHLLRWPGREWPCDKNGADNPKSQRRCAEADGTAFMCMIGRGT